MAERRVDLTTVEHFLNTLDERTFVRHGRPHDSADTLSSTDDLTTWLRSHDLPAEPVLQRDLDLARSLRAGLRATLLAARTLPELVDEPRAGRCPEPTADVLAPFPVRLRDDGGRLRLVADTGTAGLDPLVEAATTAVADGSWKRLKLCASDDCRWAFVDTSRSGGGRWCSMEVCGNRHKTRAYRQRLTG